MEINLANKISSGRSLRPMKSEMQVNAQSTIELFKEIEE